MDKTHYEKLSRMYLGARINRDHFPTTTCAIEHGLATISLEIDPSYFHALGAIHGLVYFKLLDDSAYFAAQSMVTDSFLLTTNFSTNIIRPVSEGKLAATGKIKFRSSGLLIAESTIVNEAGKEVAFGTGHFAKGRGRLSPEIGYI